jgi:hypothetical protein
MIPRTYYSSLLVVLLSLVAAVDSARLAFHFDGASHAGCKSSAYNVEIGAMKFTCDNGEDLCRPGDKVVLEGWCKCRCCIGATLLAVLLLLLIHCRLIIVTPITFIPLATSTRSHKSSSRHDTTNQGVQILWHHVHWSTQLHDGHSGERLALVFYVRQ